MNKREVLDSAKAAVCGERPESYGPPRKNFDRIAALWQAHLLTCGCSVDIRADDVAIMMVLVKVARLQETPDHDDSWVDIAGYAACGAEVSQDPKKMSKGELEAEAARQAVDAMDRFAAMGECGAYDPDALARALDSGGASIDSRRSRQQTALDNAKQRFADGHKYVDPAGDQKTSSTIDRAREILAEQINKAA